MQVPEKRRQRAGGNGKVNDRLKNAEDNRLLKVRFSPRRRVEWVGIYEHPPGAEPNKQNGANGRLAGKSQSYQPYRIAQRRRGEGLEYLGHVSKPTNPGPLPPFPKRKDALTSNTDERAVPHL
jgi:hypothetical protein